MNNIMNINGIENKIKYEELNKIFSDITIYGNKLNTDDKNIYYSYIMSNDNYLYLYIGRVLNNYIFLKYVDNFYLINSAIIVKNFVIGKKFIGKYINFSLDYYKEIVGVLNEYKPAEYFIKKCNYENIKNDLAHVFKVY